MAHEQTGDAVADEEECCKARHSRCSDDLEELACRQPSCRNARQNKKCAAYYEHQHDQPDGTVAHYSGNRAAQRNALTRRQPLVRRPQADAATAIYRLATIFALALAVALPRVVVDIAINGSPAAKSMRMSAVAEERAALPFKPSTVASNPQGSYAGLALAAKGVTLSEIVGTPYEWFASSWHSFLGVYGYMSVFGPPILYSFLAAAFTSLWFGMAVWAFVHPGARAALGLAIAGTGLVILGSIVQSWANDLQGQGRYLFPVLAIIAAYLQSQPELRKSRFVAVSISACFCGSTISFLTVALPAFANR